MTGWNLPPGCTDRMIDEAAGAPFDDETNPMTPEEERAEAWEYWHQRAIMFERQNHELRSLVQTLIDNDPDEPIADNGMTVLDGWRERARRVLSAGQPTQDDAT